MKIFFMILGSFIFFFSSCSVVRFAQYYASADSSPGKLMGRVYEAKDTSYEIGELRDSWKRINIEGGDLAFWSDKLAATITVNSTCNKNGKKVNYSLKALTNSLLIGITDKQLVESREKTINGEMALRSDYQGKLDKVPVKISAVVLKKDNCYYDLTYASSPDSFNEGLGDFEQFVSQFKLINDKK
ncbi:MAG: hypothetical protein ACRENT_03000 [Thermodesulfobacteriota bacterium]